MGQPATWGKVEEAGLNAPFKRQRINSGRASCNGTLGLHQPRAREGGTEGSRIGVFCHQAILVT